MANPTWPNTLPQYVLEDGYGEDFEDVNVETRNDVGPAKSRPRTTAGYRQFRLTIETNEAGVAIFDTFWRVTCKKGNVDFDWVHPRTRAAITFTWRKPPPKVRPRGDSRQITFSVVALVT